MIIAEPHGLSAGVYHFLVGNVTGFTWAMSKEGKPHPRRGERLKYLGFTSNIGSWPKQMSTGRLLYKPSSKFRKKQKRRAKKLLNVRQTDIVFFSNHDGHASASDRE
jgi:hypothetical protein